MFAIEKKFYLDGPGGCQRSVRVATFVEGAFSFTGKLSITWFFTKMKTVDYINIPKTSLLENSKNFFLWSDFIFHQHNTSMNCSKMTKQWISDEEIKVFMWQSISPDMYPMDNLCGFLKMRFRKRGRKQSWMPYKI